MFEYNDYWLNTVKSEINKNLMIIIDILGNYKHYLREIKRLRFRTNRIPLGEGGGNLNYAYDSVVQTINIWFEKVWFPTIENDYIKNIEEKIINLKNIIDLQFNINDPFFIEIVEINNDFLANVKKINIFLRQYLAKKAETSLLNELCKVRPFRDIYDFFQSIIIFPYWEQKGDSYLLIRQLDNFVNKMLIVLERKSNAIRTIKNNFIKNINIAIAKHEKLITDYWKHISFDKFINLLENNYLHYLETLYIHFIKFNHSVKNILSSKHHIRDIDKLRTNISNQIASSRHNITNIINYFKIQIEKINNNIDTIVCTEEQKRIVLETKQKMIASLLSNEKRLQQISDELYIFENKIALANGSNDTDKQIQNLHKLTHYLEEIATFKIEIKNNFVNNESISTIDKVEQQSFLTHALKNINYGAIENFIIDNETLSICNLHINIFNETTMKEILLQYDDFFVADKHKLEPWTILKNENTTLITQNNDTNLWKELVFTDALNLPKQHYIKLLNIFYLEFWQSKVEIVDLLETDHSPHNIMLLVKKINEKITNRKEFIEYNIKIFTQQITKWNTNNINSTLCTNEQETIVASARNKFINFLTTSKNNIETIFNDILSLQTIINENYQKYNWTLTIKECHNLVTYFEIMNQYLFNAKINFFNEFNITMEEEFSQLVTDINSNDTFIDNDICAIPWEVPQFDDMINNTMTELVEKNITHNLTSEYANLFVNNTKFRVSQPQLLLANNLNYDSSNNSSTWWIYILITAFLSISGIMTCFFTKKISAKRKKSNQRALQNKKRNKMKPLLPPTNQRDTERFNAIEISLLENNNNNTNTQTNKFTNLI